MNILSIQSHVAYGHVGNSAAVFPMQRLGVEVWPVHTVAFSNHPGYGAFKGKVFEAEFVAELIAGIEARGVFAACSGVLSGYLGTVGTGEVVLDTVARVRRANPEALYCCDPVIGDEPGGAYVRPGIADLLRDRAVPAADLLTPNHFELEVLAGGSVRTLADLRQAARALLARGPRAVLVTSLVLDDTPEGTVELAVADGSGIARMRTPLLPLEIHGGGDAIAGLFMVRFLQIRDAAAALASAGAALYGVLERTFKAGSREPLFVEAQDELVRPTHTFDVIRA